VPLAENTDGFDYFSLVRCTVYRKECLENATSHDTAITPDRRFSRWRSAGWHSSIPTTGYQIQEASNQNPDSEIFSSVISCTYYAFRPNLWPCSPHQPWITFPPNRRTIFSVCKYRPNLWPCSPQQPRTPFPPDWRNECQCVQVQTKFMTLFTTTTASVV
jgi:hypothetical protein